MGRMKHRSVVTPCLEGSLHRSTTLLLCSVLLLLSCFAIVAQRRLSACVDLFALQSFFLATTAALVAFLTGQPGGEIVDHLGSEYVSVYVPTTPNPTSGFFLMVPRADIIAVQQDIPLGELVKALENANALDDTLLCIFADHGEA